ncbi:hypothetical protein IWX50DRAFT_477862 [Phyllosticta citricarpa]
MSWLATNERDPMRHACMGNGDRIGSLCAFWNPARGEREMRAGGNWIRGRRTSRCQREGKGREEEIDAAGRAISRGELGRRSDGRVLWLKRSADLLLVSRPRPTFIPFSSGKRTTITIPSSPKHYSTRIMVQCQGKTKAGQQCLNSGPHDGYCHHHVSQQLQQPQQQPQQPSSVCHMQVLVPRPAMPRTPPPPPAGSRPLPSPPPLSLDVVSNTTDETARRMSKGERKKKEKTTQRKKQDGIDGLFGGPLATPTASPIPVVDIPPQPMWATKPPPLAVVPSSSPNPSQSLPHFPFAPPTRPHADASASASASASSASASASAPLLHPPSPSPSSPAAADISPADIAAAIRDTSDGLMRQVDAMAAAYLDFHSANGGGDVFERLVNVQKSMAARAIFDFGETLQYMMLEAGRRGGGDDEEQEDEGVAL